ncbi:hypothetical protein N9248_00645 [bacterium]|nr:hypothetical protein [bacterium]
MLMAVEIWHEANPIITPEVVRVTAGNYSGYGRYVGRCSTHGTIEFSTGNKFSRLRIEGTKLVAPDERAFLGTLLHELGHHVVNTAQRCPWEGLPAGGASTHKRSEWVWICRTAWIYFHGVDDVPSHESLARGVRSKVVDLSNFNPFDTPPTVHRQMKTCQNCGATFEANRSDTKFCSTKCRVAAKRQRDNKTTGKES